MRRLLVILVLISFLVSCKKDDETTPTEIIPDVINGAVIDFFVDPADVSTPDKAYMIIAMNNDAYKVTFNAVPEAQSNATLDFATDTLLVAESREFANLGADIVGYHPVAPNEVVFTFIGGRKITGFFNINTAFSGEFGKDQIALWREPNDPTKPTQAAKDDLRNFIRRYIDADGSGTGTAPTFLSATVTAQ